MSPADRLLLKISNSDQLDVDMQNEINAYVSKNLSLEIVLATNCVLPCLKPVDAKPEDNQSAAKAGYEFGKAIYYNVSWAFLHGMFLALEEKNCNIDPAVRKWVK